LSAAVSLFLILELDTPYAGLIKISSAPLRNTVALVIDWLHDYFQY